MYSWFLLAYLLIFMVSVEIFCPMFKSFGVTSLYEYLEVRYSPSMRYYATLLFMVQNVIYNGMVIYMPAVALGRDLKFSKNDLFHLFTLFVINK